jgi:hypothetical protein
MRASAIGKFGAVTSKKNGAVVPTALCDEADRHLDGARTDVTRQTANADPGLSVLARTRCHDLDVTRGRFVHRRLYGVAGRVRGFLQGLRRQMRVALRHDRRAVSQYLLHLEK